jgi:twitching motility protein PilT
VNVAPFRFAEIVRIARGLEASDVHVTAEAPLAFRIDGAIETRARHSVSQSDIDTIVAGYFGETQLRRLRERGDATVTRSEAEYGTVRIHAYATCGAVALAVRLLAMEIPRLEALRLPHGAARVVFCQRGLVVITGPTGSGKSTVLAAAVAEMNRTIAKHIVTIEDPIEYRHRPDRCVISQREIDSDVVSFDAAIAGALRSDPDVILLGEMRGRAAMLAAIRAAETGHLVYATMHTGNAADSIERIVGAFEGSAQAEIRTQLAETLAGVVGLRLVKRARGRGRIAAAEVLLANDAVRSAIRDAKPHHIRNIIATGRQHGMQTLEASLSELIARDEIALADARSVSSHPEELRGASAIA